MNITKRVYRGKNGGQTIRIPKYGIWKKNKRLFGKISSLFLDEVPEHIKIAEVPHKDKNDIIDYYEDYDIEADYQGKNVYKVTKEIISPYSRGIRKRVMEEEDSRRVPGLARERMDVLGFSIEKAIQMYIIIDPYIVRMLGEKKQDKEYDTLLKRLQQASESEIIIQRINRVVKEKGYQTAGYILENAIAEARRRTSPTEPIKLGYVGSLVRKKGKLKIGYNCKDKRVKKMNEEILTRIPEKKKMKTEENSNKGYNR